MESAGEAALARTFRSTGRRSDSSITIPKPLILCLYVYVYVYVWEDQVSEMCEFGGGDGRGICCKKEEIKHAIIFQG